MYAKIESLVGEVLTHIDVNGDEILLTTQSGKKYKLYHVQDCCESVSIVDTQGDWHKLLGKPLISITEDIEDGGEQEYGTCTDTTYTFRVDDHTVINKWHGESNGYYSESVDFAEITEKM